MAGVNSMELGLISDFRKKFKKGELNDAQLEDAFLIRWMRARNHNLDKAEEMLRKYLESRRDMDADNFDSWEPPAKLKEWFSGGIIGFDKNKCPAQSGEQELFLKYIEYLAYTLDEQMKGNEEGDGAWVLQYVIIVDIAGFSLTSLARPGVADFIFRFGKQMEANQPEKVKQIIFINCGKLFPLLLAIVKPILSEATKSKFEVYNQRSEWEPILLQKVSADVLPSAYGGTNTAFVFGMI